MQTCWGARRSFSPGRISLEDPFEGSWPDANHKKIEQDTKCGTGQSGSVPLWRAFMEKSKKERCFTMVNCWHKSSHESEGMWKLYAKSGFEVAIKTDFKSLVHSFTCRLPDFIAKVEYIPYESEVMPWSPWAPFLHKRLGFEHEKEVRQSLSALWANAPIELGTGTRTASMFRLIRWTSSKR